MRRVEIVGGGPAGLYAARLLKTARPDWSVTVHERMRSSKETFGFGVVLTESTMSNLMQAGPESAEDIRVASHSGHALRLQRNGESIDLHGARNLAIARNTLLEVLGRHARAAGVVVRSGEQVQASTLDADVVIAADGVRSATREKLASLPGASRRRGRTRFRALRPGEFHPMNESVNDDCSSTARQIARDGSTRRPGLLRHRVRRLVVESAPPSRRNVLNVVMLAGFPAGGVVASIAGITLLEQAGFRALFALGALPLVTLVPLALWLLPETSQPVATGQKRGRRALDLTGRHAVALALFALANVCGFLLVYGLNTWLPQLMRQAGYPLGSAISFLLVFNLGAVAGGLIGARLADRFNGKPVAAGAFGLGVVAISMLALPMPQALLYLVIAVAGGSARRSATVALVGALSSAAVPARATMVDARQSAAIAPSR